MKFEIELDIKKTFLMEPYVVIFLYNAYKFQISSAVCV